jgi:hypothetical protein
MRRIAAPAVLSLALVLGSCEGGDGRESSTGDTGSAEAPCEPVDRLELIAEGHSFGTSCLAVPADRVVRGSLESLDFEPHNFAVYRKVPGTDQQALFAPNLQVRSDNAFPGERARFRVPRLQPGRYFYRCDFHPAEMTGFLHAV